MAPYYPTVKKMTTGKETIQQNKAELKETKVKVQPKNYTYKMKTWDDYIRIVSPNGVYILSMSSEQMTVYSSFFMRTTVCAPKDKIKIDDKTDEKYVYVNYNGEPHYDSEYNEAG